MIEGLDKLTPSAGVYLFKDKKGKVLYIGKASNLKNRVSSYFRPSSTHSPKVAAMVSQVSSVELKETEGEISALLLESQLVKKHRPSYNTKLKDDKTPYYLAIDYGLEYPSVRLVRKIREGNIKTFGPYPETNVVWAAKTIRQMFPWRDCTSRKFLRHQRLKRPCLYGEVGVCPALCGGKIGPKEYGYQLRLLEKFLKGGEKQVVTYLKQKMKKASFAKNYEKAAYLRDQISRIEKMVTWKSPPLQFDNGPDSEHRRRECLSGLRDMLLDLKIPLSKKWFPQRIEAFDVSNISGQHAVGSMVVFTEGIPDKAEYRRFRIKYTTGPNDTAMIKEVVERRLAKWPQNEPDLILIDGGKSQVSAVLEILRKKKHGVPVIGLAKREEALVIFVDKRWLLVKLTRDSEVLQFLMRVRDESHRFAISYHRKLRRALQV